MVSEQAAESRLFQQSIDQSQIRFAPSRCSITEQKQVGSVCFVADPFGFGNRFDGAVKIRGAFQCQVFHCLFESRDVLRRVGDVFAFPELATDIEEQHIEFFQRITIVVQCRFQKLQPHVELVGRTAERRIDHKDRS